MGKVFLLATRQRRTMPANDISLAEAFQIATRECIDTERRKASDGSRSSQTRAEYTFQVPR